MHCGLSPTLTAKTLFMDKSFRCIGIGKESSVSLNVKTSNLNSHLNYNFTTDTAFITRYRRVTTQIYIPWDHERGGFSCN